MDNRAKSRPPFDENGGLIRFVSLGLVAAAILAIGVALPAAVAGGWVRTRAAAAGLGGECIAQRIAKRVAGRFERAKPPANAFANAVHNATNPVHNLVNAVVAATLRAAAISRDIHK
jgi:hypothetical protein